MAKPLKSKPMAVVKPKAKNVVSVIVEAGENSESASARTLSRPEVQAAATIQLWQQGICEVDALANTLTMQVEAVNNGNMKRPEAMLLAQAHTLDELFNSLARRTHGQQGLAQFDTFLRLALKAQSQCRSTLEALAAIKNPPVIFAKQANISNGHQQINNGTMSNTRTHAQENINPHSELITEGASYEAMDTTGKSKAGRTNQAMATMD